MTLLRFGLCAVALWFLYRNVNVYDHIHLAGGERVRLIQQRDDGFFIERGGVRETVALDAVRRVGDDRLPDVEYGIVSVVQRTDMWPNERNWGAVVAILIFGPATLLQGLRLVWMLAIQNVHLSWWNALKMSFAGNFFNFALPGTTGGDVIKAVYITRFTHHKTEAVTAVFLDRVVGMLGLIIVAGAMILFSRKTEQFKDLSRIFMIATGALVLFAAPIFSRRIRGALQLSKIAAKLPLGDHIIRVGRATVMMRRHKTLVLMCLLNTVALQFIVMLSGYFMAMSMGMTGYLPTYLIYIAAGFLIAAIPISPPQAFGVMEYAYIVFFARSNPPLASVSQAVAFALAIRLIQLLWALPGVLVPLLGAHLPSKSELENLASPEAPDNALSAAPP